MSEQATYPAAPIAEKLRDLREHLPGQSKFLYRFAGHVADRLTPSHELSRSVYAHVFPRVALSAFLDIRFDKPDHDVVTVYGYTIPKRLFGHPIDSSYYLFDMIPTVFSAITEGNLEAEILRTFEAIRRGAPERLDAVFDQDRTTYKEARTSRVFEKDAVDFVDFPSTLSPEIASLQTMPPRLFWYDTTCGGFRRGNPTHYVPLPINPGWMPIVAWARIKE